MLATAILATKASPRHGCQAMGQGWQAKCQETVAMVDTAELQPVTMMHQADAAPGQASAGGAAPGLLTGGVRHVAQNGGFGG